MDDEQELQRRFDERFKQLPEVVQHAITSADVEQHLREMATRHKLHVDQWDLLENEVKLTLYGFQPAEELARNLKASMDIDDATAAALAADITEIVFEPIRQELERQLNHPDAVEKGQTEIEQLREQELQKHRDSELLRAEAEGALPPPPKVPDKATVQEAAKAIQQGDASSAPANSAAAATPASTPAAAAPVQTPAPTAKETAPQVVREPISESYKPGVLSTERKAVHDDPYREPPV